MYGDLRAWRFTSPEIYEPEIYEPGYLRAQRFTSPEIYEPGERFFQQQNSTYLTSNYPFIYNVHVKYGSNPIITFRVEVFANLTSSFNNGILF